MRLKTLLLTIALAANLVWAQAPPPAKPEPAKPTTTESFEAEVIHVKTLTGDSFRRLARMLAVFNVGVTSDENLRTIVVYAPKDVVTQIRRVVAELDTPGSEAAIGRNIEMNLTFLRCSTKAAATAATLPADVEAVAKQLRATTQYKDILLWDTLPLRLQEGTTTVENMYLPAIDTVSVASGLPAPILNLRIQPEAATRKGTNWSVRFARMEIDFKMPVITGTFGDGNGKSAPQFTYQDFALNTTGDFVEGQKTVLGKVSAPTEKKFVVDGVTDRDTGSSTPFHSDSTAIFVVISLKVLD